MSFARVGVGSATRDFGAGWLPTGRERNGLAPFLHSDTGQTIMANQPAHKFKIGLITATVWRNDGFYSVDLSRSYKTDTGEWRNTGSFHHSDLLNLAKCAERAEIWIGRQISAK